MQFLTLWRDHLLGWLGQALGLIPKLWPSSAKPRGGRVKVTVTIEHD
jgi:hypothetical protein